MAPKYKKHWPESTQFKPQEITENATAEISRKADVSVTHVPVLQKLINAELCLSRKLSAIIEKSKIQVQLQGPFVVYADFEALSESFS